MPPFEDPGKDDQEVHSPDSETQTVKTWKEAWNASPGPGQRKSPPQMVLQGQDFFMLRMVVFDEKGSVMLGFLQDHPPKLMEDLFHENVLIGKIALYPPEMMPHPRDELFLKTQKTIF